MAKYDVFISYASKDAIPPYVCQRLEERGVKCWIASRDIDPGTPYARAIMQGLAECHTVLVFITSNSLQSEDVLNEIDNAHGLKKTIIPIFIENVELLPEFNYYLKRKQWINAYEGNMYDLMDKLGNVLGFSSNSVNRGYDSTASKPSSVIKDVVYEVYLSKPGPSRPDVARYLIGKFDYPLVFVRELILRSDRNPVLLTTVKDKSELNNITDELSKVGAVVTYKEKPASYGVSNPYDLYPTNQGPFDVYLTNVGTSKLQVVKYIVDTFRFPLKESKEIADNCSTFGRTLLTTVNDIKDFVEIRDALANIGATAVYKEHEERIEPIKSSVSSSSQRSVWGEKGVGYEVFLSKVGKEKLAVVKYVNQKLRLGLKDAKELVDKCCAYGKVYMTTLRDFKEVEMMKKELASVGAEIEYTSTRI